LYTFESKVLVAGGCVCCLKGPLNWNTLFEFCPPI